MDCRFRAGCIGRHPIQRQPLYIFMEGRPPHRKPAQSPDPILCIAVILMCLDVNYRGSTGFGLKYRNAIKEDGWGGREQADIATGAQALIQAGLATAWKGGRNRHILWWLQRLVPDHPLPTGNHHRCCSHLRHDRPGGGLQYHPP